ncbi:hypothetical protein DFR70_13016 [Nocardia tenerifensis]|uniref:Uncharacterized protein n=1 Tax=Nocardia tenerifensis TaxID=228006 RepID=A0A318JLG4_9NOCA|nr:hypothetical protein [Nocardia tenerifensis]PXX52768.1 hypothetical protein DFR70_13016 [Nocardia tenerifensis]
MPDNTSRTDGLLRYRIFLIVETSDGEDTLSFNAYGHVLPRIGEELELEGGDGELSVTVTNVDHWFHAGEDLDHPGVTVTGGLVGNPNQELVNRLINEPGALKAWHAPFPRLEAVDFTPKL